VVRKNPENEVAPAPNENRRLNEEVNLEGGAAPDQGVSAADHVGEGVGPEGAGLVHGGVEGDPGGGEHDRSTPARHPRHPENVVFVTTGQTKACAASARLVRSSTRIKCPRRRKKLLLTGGNYNARGSPWANVKKGTSALTATRTSIPKSKK